MSPSIPHENARAPRTRKLRYLRNGKLTPLSRALFKVANDQSYRMSKVEMRALDLLIIKAAMEAKPKRRRKR